MLCCSNFCDQRVQVFFELAVFLQGQRGGCPFNHLKNIGVIEPETLVLPVDLAGRDRKVGDSTSLLAFLKIIRDSHLTVRLDAMFPETIIHLYGSRWHRGNRIVARMLLRLLGNHESHRCDPEQEYQPKFPMAHRLSPILFYPRKPTPFKIIAHCILATQAGPPLTRRFIGD